MEQNFHFSEKLFPFQKIRCKAFQIAMSDSRVTISVPFQKFLGKETKEVPVLQTTMGTKFASLQKTFSIPEYKMYSVPQSWKRQRQIGIIEEVFTYLKLIGYMICWHEWNRFARLRKTHAVPEDKMFVRCVPYSCKRCKCSLFWLSQINT